MHLLAAKPGGFTDEEGIVDLAQSPGDIVILSAQDSSLGLLSEVADQLPADYPQLRLANLIHLARPAAYDLYEETVLQHSQLIVVALLGGVSYWRYGVEQLQALAQKRGISLVLVPGDDQPDFELSSISNCADEICFNVWRYLREGGQRNTRNLLHYLAGELLEKSVSHYSYEPPRNLPPCLIYQGGDDHFSLEDWQKQKNERLPTALLLFYRSHVQSGNTDAFDQFIAILQDRFNLMAVAAVSLKDPACLATINHLINAIECDVIVNTTSFSQHTEGNAALSSQPQRSYAATLARRLPRRRQTS